MAGTAMAIPLFLRAHPEPPDRTCDAEHRIMVYIAI